VAELLANVEIRDSKDEPKERRHYLQQLQLLHHILYHTRTLREVASLDLTYTLRSAIIQWALACDDPQAKLIKSLAGLRSSLEQREQMFVATVVVEMEKYENYTKVDLLREDDAGEDDPSIDDDGATKEGTASGGSDAGDNDRNGDGQMESKNNKNKNDSKSNKKDDKRRTRNKKAER